MERIEEIKQREEAATKKLASLEDRQVDEEILRDQLSQLQAYLQNSTVARFHVDTDTVASQLRSDKPAIVANAAQRVIAACNAQFMSTASDEAAPKRKRVTAPPAGEPAAAAPAAAPTAAMTTGSDALRRALAARY